MTYLNQSFGVEFECYLPESSSQSAVARAVSQRLQARGFDRGCMAENYNHITRTDWKVVADGSLGDYSRGIELVSPVLMGEAGLREVAAVAEALSDFGCTVNRKCGFHVHVGAAINGAAVSLDFLKNAVRIYAAFEPVIDAMMPASRRAQNNAYCRSLESLNGNRRALERAANVDEIRTCIAGRFSNESRYFKLNLDALRRHRTIEFRQHSGTLDATKSTRWVSICLKMAFAARKADVQIGTVAAEVPRAVNRARQGSKAWQVGQMLLRPEGVTGQEICAALHWPSVSIPAQARACGLAFTTRREGREVRYWATSDAPQVDASVPRADISISGFAALIDLSDAEREYIEQRTRDLAGSVSWAA
jgi:hypothetical protein